MPSCHRFLSVGTFNKEAFINLGMRFSMGDIRPPHNQNAQDLSRWVVCLLVTQKNEQLQKSDEISFQLKIYNEATWWKPRFSLCELFFLLGFFLLMFLNSLKKMQWYIIMFEKKLFCEWNPENMVLFVCRSSYQVPNLQGHSGRWPYLACLCWSFPGKNKWYISSESGPNHHPIESESNWIKPCQHWTWKIIEITNTYVFQELL